MELLFNIAWLAIVGIIGIVAVARRRAIALPVVAAALVCVAILLFPAVSVSDDLHQEVLLVEDSSKRIAQALGVHYAIHFDTATLFLAIVALRSLIVFASRFHTAPRMSSHTLDGFLQSADGRAPPALLA